MHNTPPVTLHEGKFLRLVDLGGWEFVERRNIRGIVGIVAVTDDGSLLLVEQYRPPLGCRVVELPAGICGDDSDSESMADAARRELLEETGYAAGNMIQLTEGPTSSGLSSEVIALFRATGLKKVSAGGGDEHEDITVHRVPLEQVAGFLEDVRRSGRAVDLKIYAALHFTSGARAIHSRPCH